MLFRLVVLFDKYFSSIKHVGITNFTIIEDVNGLFRSAFLFDSVSHQAVSMLRLF